MPLPPTHHSSDSHIKPPKAGEFSAAGGGRVASSRLFVYAPRLLKISVPQAV